MRRKLTRPWTDHDAKELRRLAAAKWTVGRIGARLKRSARSVKIRAKAYGITLAVQPSHLRKEIAYVEKPADAPSCAEQPLPL
jgi:hypothetical protein